MKIHICAKCGQATPIPDDVKIFACACNSTQDNEATRRVKICVACEMWVSQGCGLYPKPCRVLEMWRDQIPPPSRCPHKTEIDPDSD